MRQIMLFTTTIQNARNIAINRAAKDKVRVGVVGFRSDVPLLITEFKDKEIDLLVIPSQFIGGWYLKGYDANIEFCDDFPKNDHMRELAKGILGKK